MLARTARPGGVLDPRLFTDPEQAERERFAIEVEGPTYRGNRALVPVPGQYRVDRDGARVLVNDEGQLRVLSNICPHRHFPLLDGAGDVGRAIVCPAHRWSFRLDGGAIGAPDMDVPAGCDLLAEPTWSVFGLVFAGQSLPFGDLLPAGIADHLDPADYVLDRVEVETVLHDWKIFVELFCDLYHVRPFHPGLGRYCDFNRFEWVIGEHGSTQIVGLGDLDRPGSAVYGQWQDLMRARWGGRVPDIGVVWVTLHPNVMVEWYHDHLVVASVWPDGPGRCICVTEFLAAPGVPPAQLDAFRLAYAETAEEDVRLGVGMQRSREMLARRGQAIAPVDHPRFDVGVAHFYDWVTDRLL